MTRAPEDAAVDDASALDASPTRPTLDIAALAAVAVLLVVDVIEDFGSSSRAHMALEIGTIAVSVFAGARLWLRWVRVRRALEARLVQLGRKLSSTREDAERWKAEAHEALAGLGVAIEHQCDRWKLTEAEREVTLLLLKGLSLKEIAVVRSTSERTARQQSLAVYRKAGLGGRAELAAFFLEDLLLPKRPDGIDHPT